MSEVKQIVFEVEERVVVRSGEFTTAGDCPFCGETVAMGTPCTAAALYDMSEREIFRMIEAGGIHFTETGQVMICLKSIREYLLEAGKVHFVEPPRIHACVSCNKELVKTDLTHTSVIQEEQT